MLTGYDEEWVCQRFREARYPKQQIKILAECCCTTKQEILSILHLHGLALDMQPPPSPERNELPPQEFAKRWEIALPLLRKGLTYKEISARSGISISRISRWGSVCLSHGWMTAEEVTRLSRKRRLNSPVLRRMLLAEKDKNGQV